MRRLSGRAAEAILLAAVLAAPWPYGSTPDTARYALVVALLVAGVGWAAEQWRSGAPVPALAMPALALVAFPLLQAAAGLSVAPAWSVDAALVLGGMLATMLVWSERARDRHAALRLAVAVLLTCGAQAVFGAVQWSLSPTRIYGRTSQLVTMPFGSFVNHNHFAGLVGMGVVLALGMAVGRARRSGLLSPWVVVLGGVGLALTAAHLASRSRGGLLALVAGIALCVVGLGLDRGDARRALRPGWILAGLAVATVTVGFGLLAVSPGARSHLGTLLRGSPDGSGEYRLDIAAATLRLAVSRPLLGSGVGAFADAIPAYKRGHGLVRTTYAESDVLEFLAEGGLVGNAVVAWLAVVILGGFMERIRRGRDPFRKGMAVGALAACATLLVHGLVDFNLRLPSNALVFCSLLGLVAATPAEGRTWGGRWPGLALAGAFFLLAFAAAWRTHGAWALEQALGAREPARRIEALDDVVQLHPYLAEARRARGLAWRELGLTPSVARAGRLERAQRDVSAAVRLRPQWAEAWADLGWTRAIRGDIGGARKDLDRANALDPTHPGIRAARAEFERRFPLPPRQ